MKRERIRVRPTGLWLVFGPVLGCMWLAAVNYTNNLVYGVLYLVASLTFVSLFHTWRNLAGLEIEQVRFHPAFARENVRVEIHLRNAGAVPVYGLLFSLVAPQMRPRDAVPLRHGPAGWQLAPGDSGTIELDFPADRRGHYRIAALLVRTTYPFGLIGARFRVPLNTHYFVYPEAKGSDLLPERHTGGKSGFVLSTHGGDDFAGVRPYQPGESLRHVDWKAYARGRPLAVKQFAGGDGRELWLDASETSGLPLEKRLSQLAYWIVLSEKQEVPYGFRFGTVALEPGLGPDHSRRALEALAVAE
jgi:uncharacterized protein (DUF58 family)